MSFDLVQEIDSTSPERRLELSALYMRRSLDGWDPINNTGQAFDLMVHIGGIVTFQWDKNHGFCEEVMVRKGLYSVDIKCKNKCRNMATRVALVKMAALLELLRHDYLRKI